MKIISYLPDVSKALKLKVAMIARTAGLEFYEAISRETTIKKATENVESLIFMHVNDIDFIYECEIYAPKSMIVLLSSGHTLPQLAKKMISSSLLSCFVATKDEDLDAKDMLIVIKKFKERQIFGLDKYLSYGADIRTDYITTISDKVRVIDKIEAFILGLSDDRNSSKFKRYARRTAEVIDELVLNAVFDANPNNNSLPRSTNFSLSGEHLVTVKWGFDGLMFGMSVLDNFGHLHKETVLKYLDESLKIEDTTHDYNTGLGLRSVFDKIKHLVINVEPNKRTEIVTLLKIEERFKDSLVSDGSFHYFSL